MNIAIVKALEDDLQWVAMAEAIGDHISRISWAAEGIVIDTPFGKFRFEIEGGRWTHNGHSLQGIRPRAIRARLNYAAAAIQSLPEGSFFSADIGRAKE